MIAERYLKSRFEAGHIEGMEKGRREIRQRVKQALDDLGDQITPEARDYILGKTDGRQQERERVRKILDKVGDKLTPEERDLILGKADADSDPKKE